MLRHLQLVADAPSDLGVLRGRTVAVIGYGSQGHAHALNLRDSGATVVVAQRLGGPGFDRALGDGFEVVSTAAAASRAELLVLGVPDESLPAVFSTEIAPHLRPGQALGFLHGFNLHYQTIALPPA
ncbi:MAG: NAD(P)-binding domain-containing protein, partial [Phycisphaerae bacterium]